MTARITLVQDDRADQDNTPAGVLLILPVFEKDEADAKADRDPNSASG